MVYLRSMVAVLIIVAVVFTKDNLGQQFTGQENHAISLSEASQMTNNFRNSARANQITGGYFGKDIILKILEQPNCVGIRYYYGVNSMQDPVLVLVGVDENGDDLYNGVLGELSQPCPPYCSSPNPLNQ